MKSKKISALLLSMALCSFLFGGATASEKPHTEIDAMENVMVGEPIGGIDDQDGVLLPDGPVPRKPGYLFQLSASGVTQLLTTHNVSGKNFTGGKMDYNEGINIDGTLTNTKGNSIKVGVCYYNRRTAKYDSVYGAYFSSGSYGNVWAGKMNGQSIRFGNSTTYYGYINNHSGSGSVSGTIYYFIY